MLHGVRSTPAADEGAIARSRRFGLYEKALCTPASVPPTTLDVNVDFLSCLLVKIVVWIARTHELYER